MRPQILFKLAKDSAHPFCDEGGAILGDGVALLEKDASGHWSPRPQAQLESLLSLGYGGPVELSSRMGWLRQVAKYLNDGKVGQAGIALLHAQLPPLPSREAARRMAKADRLGKYNRYHVPAGAAYGRRGEFDFAPNSGAGLSYAGFSQRPARASRASEQSPALRGKVKFGDLVANFPGHKKKDHNYHDSDPMVAGNIWSFIGGHVAMNAWTTDDNGNRTGNNTCALRMSYALNHSGLTIPKQPGTVSGSDGEQYFLRVADLQKYLTKTLGEPERLPGGGPYEGPKGQSGIISFNVPFPDATGHFTLWSGRRLIDKDGEPYDRWPHPTSILFWRLK